MFKKDKCKNHCLPLVFNTISNYSQCVKNKSWIVNTDWFKNNRSSWLRFETCWNSKAYVVLLLMLLFKDILIYVHNVSGPKDHLPNQNYTLLKGSLTRDFLLQVFIVYLAALGKLIREKKTWSEKSRVKLPLRYFKKFESSFLAGTVCAPTTSLLFGGGGRGYESTLNLLIKNITVQGSMGLTLRNRLRHFAHTCLCVSTPLYAYI